MRGATIGHHKIELTEQFQSTLLVRGATWNIFQKEFYHYISIHAPRERSDIHVFGFQNTSLISIHAPRERSDMFSAIKSMFKDISIHAPRERSDYDMIVIFEIDCISIHAPRERSDRKCYGGSKSIAISIHAPRERSDLQVSSSDIVLFRFQSTLLVRGATIIISYINQHFWFQSTLLVRGATYNTNFKVLQIYDFNPRSSWEERHLIKAHNIIYLIFQSTLLVRGATAQKTPVLINCDISIHAPRERSDFRQTLLTDFNTLFQSTLLVRGATFDSNISYSNFPISIHAPRERSDGVIFKILSVPRDFNPRSSWEERPCFHN